MEKETTDYGCLTPAELKTRQQAGDRIRIIDVRSPEEFQEKHIPDAINIPLDDLEKSIPAIDPKILLVTACGKGGGRSAKGAELLRELGFDALWLCGGTFGWFEETK